MTFKPFAFLLSLCVSLALHLLLGLSMNAVLQGKQTPIILQAGGTAGRLAARLTDGGHSPNATNDIEETQRAGEVASAQAAYSQSQAAEKTVVVSESAISVGRFYTASEVDYPAEFRDQVDFDAVLRGLPMPHAMLRLQVFVDAKGAVKAVRWETEAHATALMQRLIEYVSAQPFRPAMKDGTAVASRLRLEFEVGRVIREDSDLPLIPPTPPTKKAR